MHTQAIRADQFISRTPNLQKEEDTNNRCGLHYEKCCHKRRLDAARNNNTFTIEDHRNLPDFAAETESRISEFFPQGQIPAEERLMHY